jgi:hypothetical protein
MTVAPEVGADHLTILDVSPPDLVSVARDLPRRTNSVYRSHSL